MISPGSTHIGTYPGCLLELGLNKMHFTMSPREFECQLFYRWGLPYHFIIKGIRSYSEGSARIDVYDAHITVESKQDGYRHRTHENNARSIESMARFRRIRIHTDRGAKMLPFPYSKCRPDLSFIIAPKRHLIVVFDLMVTRSVGTQSLYHFCFERISCRRQSICG